MTKKLKAILTVLAIIFILVGLFIWANIDTITMIKDGITESTETIITKKEEVKNKEKEVLKDAGINNVRPLTEEETEEFKSGNISEDDAIDLILGKTTIDKVKENKNNGTDVTSNGSGEKTSDNKTNDKTPSTSGDSAGKEDVAPKTPVEKNDGKDTSASDKNQSSGTAASGNSKGEKNNESTAKPVSGDSDNKNSQQMTDTEAKIAELVGKIYVLEARFTSELGSLEAWAINEYESVPKEQKKAKKKELADIGFPKLTALEKDCDTKVEVILSELRTVLKESGQDTALVEQIRDSYENKKQLTKSYYISEYL